MNKKIKLKIEKFKNQLFFRVKTNCQRFSTYYVGGKNFI